jgi:hypothetical protein
MSRPRRATRTIRKEVFLDESLVAQVELQLFSTVQGRVPYGAWAALLTPLLHRALRRQSADQGAVEALASGAYGARDVIASILEDEGYVKLAGYLRSLYDVERI